MPEPNVSAPIPEPHGRHEFKKTVRDLLEKQARSLCCNPGCQQPTRAASFDGKRSINIGTAAHIHAASAKGPRYDGNMSQLEREADTNGIWLCRNCGTLVDDDHSAFPPDILLEWKEKALKARRESVAAPAARITPVAVDAKPSPLAKNNDIARYQKFVMQFPSTGGAFAAVARFDAAVPFESRAFQRFYDFLTEWTAPENGFSNLTVQAALRTLAKAVSGFLDAVVLNTFVTDRPPGCVGVPKEWKDTNQSKYFDTVNGLNALADQVEAAHTALIMTARNELGI